MSAMTLFPEATTAPQTMTREDLYKLIYGDGGNSPATVQFHSDGGHGWLQVPHSVIDKLGIKKKITAYSFKDKNYAYLEEDCDLSTFVVAAGLREIMKDFWSIVPQKDRNYPHPIRNKTRYC